MIYSDVVIDALIVVFIFDLLILRTAMLTKGRFWLTYAIILPFQLLTNWWLTSKNIVMYAPNQIMGKRVAGAPIEDLLFGFSLVVASLSFWEYFSKKNKA